MQQSGMTNPPEESDREQEEIEQKLLEALGSPAIPIDEDFWTELRRIAHERARSTKPGAPS
jgi:hypothetical protein